MGLASAGCTRSCPESAPSLDPVKAGKLASAEWMAQALETTYELFSKIVTGLNAEGFVLDGASDPDGELAKEGRGLTSND
jgi:hypothetical protein